MVDFIKFIKYYEILKKNRIKWRNIKKYYEKTRKNKSFGFYLWVRLDLSHQNITNYG